MKNHILTPDNDDADCTDFTFAPDDGSFWVTIGPVSLYVVAGAAGVSVELYPTGHAMEAALDVCACTFTEAETAIKMAEQT